MKKLIYIFLVLCLFSVTVTSSVFAEEQGISVVNGNAKVVYEDDEKALIEYMPLDEGYGNNWSTTGSGSFTVYTPYSGTLGFTFKVESSSSSSWAAINVTKPGQSSPYWNYLVVNAGQEQKKVAYGAPSGTYTITFTGYTPNGMRVMCWIYKG